MLQSWSEKKASSLIVVLWLFGLAILAYFNLWWPGIMVVVAVNLLVHYLHRRQQVRALVAAGVCLVVFTAQQLNLARRFNLSDDEFLGIVFAILGLWALQQFFSASTK